jgi:hypothetical protein
VVEEGLVVGGDLGLDLGRDFVVATVVGRPWTAGAAVVVGVELESPLLPQPAANSRLEAASAARRAVRRELMRTVLFLALVTNERAQGNICEF